MLRMLVVLVILGSFIILTSPSVSAQIRRPAARHPAPLPSPFSVTQPTAIGIFPPRPDKPGYSVYFSSWFPALEGMTVTDYYINQRGEKKIAPGRYPVTIESADAGKFLAVWFLGYRTWGQPLPEGAIAFETDFTGVVNFTVRANVNDPPLEAKAYADGRVFVRGTFATPTMPVASLNGTPAPIVVYVDEDPKDNWGQGWLITPSQYQRDEDVIVMVASGFPKSISRSCMVDNPIPVGEHLTDSPDNISTKSTQ